MEKHRARLYGGAAALVLIAGAGGYGLAKLAAQPPSASAPATEPAKTAHSDAVLIKAEAIDSAGIAVEAVSPGGISSEILTQATVAPTPTGQALVTARASGAVIRILKRLGDPVRAGETLAVIESREAAQIAADRSVAAAKSTLAERNLAREKSLYDQRVSPRMDYEQAQAEAAAAAAEVRRAQLAANAARVTGDGRGVTVASPISGRITAAPASLGAFVQPETELFRIADPRATQVEASVGAMDIGRIAAGDRAVVELADGRTLEGRVRAVTPTLDPESRSALAVLDVPNVGLQPGQTARARLFPRLGLTGPTIVVPEDAVQTLEGRQVVFVRTARGFQARPVTVGRRSAGRVEIISGLTAGQSIATRNAFLLKAELGKGEGGED